ncbi:hypothetical protein ACFQ3Z_44285 [Streptomyces nogalater]
MSTYTPATVEVLQTLGLAPGLGYLEPGPGPGVCLALAATLTGPGLATGVERDGHMADWARRNLDRVGVARRWSRATRSTGTGPGRRTTGSSPASACRASRPCGWSSSRPVAGC